MVVVELDELVIEVDVKDIVVVELVVLDDVVEVVVTD